MMRRVGPTGDAGEDHTDYAQADARQLQPAEPLATQPGKQGGDHAIGGNHRRDDRRLADGEGLRQRQRAAQGEAGRQHAHAPIPRRGAGQLEQEGGKHHEQQAHQQQPQGLAEEHRALHADGPGIQPDHEIRSTPKQGRK
ncbi:Uncharacterized protein APZ42_002283 [Daphnia magna]|uniref:Uncharacterized protein n=1 Tax=Daphnia magna TaxID=35525 RepID=A0A164IDJ6_9CRUS|nr:Uncharacterized protein APZ42_002283 [Daphnia magna]